LRSAALQQATQKCDDQSLPVTAIITRKIHHKDFKAQCKDHVATRLPRL